MLEKRARHLKLLAAMDEENLDAWYQSLAKKVSVISQLHIPVHILFAVSAVSSYISLAVLAVLGLEKYCVYVVMALAFVGLYWVGIEALGKHWTGRYIELKPVAETPNLCASCLELTNVDDNAREWRNNAVAQGRQLRGFDYEMMYELYKVKREAAAARQAQDLAQQELEESRIACAALHTATS